MAYYNNFDKEKDFHEVRFNAGKPLQSAELNEMQSIIEYKSTTVTNFLVADGTIMEGADVLSIQIDRLVLGSGVVSAQGKAIRVDQKVISLTGLPEDIGIKIVKSIVTANDDDKLLQPDKESPYYGKSSADRLKVVGTWCKSTELNAGDLFFPVVSVSMGSILQYYANRNGNQDYVIKSIAKYDKGVHGSYVVDGLIVRHLSDITDSLGNRVSYELGSGIARVNGNEIVFPQTTVFNLEPITGNFKSVSNEPVVFQRGVTDYTLRNIPIKSVKSISGPKEVTKTITHGSHNGVNDNLPDTPVLKIIEVKQGGTTYSVNTDFKQFGDQISWSPKGNEPAPGSQYTVKYQYIDTFSGTESLGKLSIGNADAQNLVDGAVLSVTYDFYLTRIDRVVIDANTRNLAVVKGVPAVFDEVLPPVINNSEQLSVATIMVQYNMKPQISQEETVTMIPFASIKKMQSQVSALQYNVAQLSLKDEARSHDPVTNKRGIVVDSLANNNMRDLGISQDAIIEDGILTTGTIWTNELFVNEVDLKLGVAAETVLTDQSARTDDQRINPYAVPSSNPVGEMTINPSVIYGNAWDPSYDGETLPRTVQVSCNISLFQGGEQVDIIYRGSVNQTISTDSSGSANFVMTITEGTPYSRYVVSAVGKISKAEATASFSISKNNETFTQFRIDKVAEDSARGDQILQSQMDTAFARLDALENELRNTNTRLQQEIDTRTRENDAQQKELDRLKRRLDAGESSLQGQIDRLSSQILTNRRSIEGNRQSIISNNQQINELKNRRVVITTTNGRLTGVKNADWIRVNTDPVAQSFVPEREVDISAISFYLTELPTKPITLKLVENVAGQPDITKIVGYGRLSLSTLKLGWNKLVLESTTTLREGQEYSFIVITESFEGKVAIAKVGNRDQNNNNAFIKTQVHSGVLFLSANEFTWTPVQDSDMTFKLHQVTYEPERIIKLATITPSNRHDNLTDFRLVGSKSDKSAHNVEFYMTIGSKRYSLALNRTIHIPVITKSQGNIEVFCKLNTVKASSTPVVSSGLMLLMGKVRTPASYITRRFDIKNGAVQPASIQVILNQRVPSETDLSVFYQHSSGDNDFTPITTRVSTENIGDGWQTVVYQVDNVQKPNSRIKLSLTSSHYANRPEVKDIRILMI